MKPFVKIKGEKQTIDCRNIPSWAYSEESFRCVADTVFFQSLFTFQHLTLKESRKQKIYYS